jgi:diguanylate cyclase (GGDEF)-like protein/PAS domain S-box-containing protein
MSEKISWESLKKRVERLEKVEKKLREMKARLEDEVGMWNLLFEQSRDGIVILDENGKLFKANKQFAYMLGYTMEEIAGLHVWDWDDLYSKEQLLKMAQTVDPDGVQFQTRHKRKDGTVIDVELSNSGTVYKGKKLIFCVCRDVTERKRMERVLKESEKKYQELSITDELTQLYNARHFFKQLGMEVEKAARYGNPLSLMFLDLDDFKQFNDAYGHPEGDKVLKKMGEVIKGGLRRTDLAFRYGGEEFAVLMPMTTAEDGGIAAERIRTEFKKEGFSPVEGVRIHLTASIGVAEYARQFDINTFLRHVDNLMYQAKKQGKNRTCTSTVI